jgi:hypothetical protein
MGIAMPPTFPEAQFRAFIRSATKFFPELMSDENLSGPQEKKRHFDWSCQAVRHRYRSCSECNDEFIRLLGNASKLWRTGWEDEELTYNLERCIYLFFVSGLSAFDSFAFCLYFLGHAIRPTLFAAVANPRMITRRITSEALSAVFPDAQVTKLLAGLPQDPAFNKISETRNLLAHRISGRRSICVSSTIEPGGTLTELRKDTWHHPGSKGELIFDGGMLQHHLDHITRLLSALAAQALEFADGHSAGPLVSPKVG